MVRDRKKGTKMFVFIGIILPLFLLVSLLFSAYFLFDDEIKLSPSDAGLILHYQFDEVGYSGSVGEVVDSSGFNGHGKTVNGPAISTTGYRGNNVVFDGINDYIETNANINLGTNVYNEAEQIEERQSALLNGPGVTANVAAGGGSTPTYVPMTSVFWIKSNPPPLIQTSGSYDYTLIGNSPVEGNPNTNFYILYHIGKSALDKTRFEFVSSSCSQGHGLVPRDSNWHQLAVVRGLTKYDLYVDGVLSFSGTCSQSLFTTNSPLYLARDSGNVLGRQGGWFNGNIDELRMYKRALSSAEINSLYLGDNPGIVISIPGQEENVFEAPASVTLNSVSTSGFPLTEVEYYENGLPLGYTSVAPHTLNLNNLAIGQHTITAIGWSTRGDEVSGQITITVQSSGSVIPIALYKFSETKYNGTEKEVRDSSGFGYHGKGFNRARPVPEGIDGGSLELDGISNVIVPNFSIDTNEMTLSFWMNPKQVAVTKRIIEHNWNDNSKKAFSTSLTGNTFSWTVVFTDGSSKEVTANLPGNLIDVWSQITLRYTPGNPNGVMDVFYNGFKVGTTTTLANLKIRNTSTELLIGGNTAGTGFYGSLDEVTFYKKAIIDEEIKNNYNVQKAKIESDYKRRAVLKYSFEEVSYNGTLAETRDTSGKNNHGNAHNGATTTFGGVNGRALLLERANDGVTINGLSLNDTYDRTVSVWVKPKTLSDPDNLLISGTGLYGLALRDTNNVISLYDNNGNWKSFGISADLNAWQQLVFVFKGTTARLYKNGVLVGTVPYTPQSLTGNSTIGSHIKSANYMNDMNGSVDEFIVYDRALNTSEVNDAYNEERRTLHSTASTLRAYYKFDEFYYSAQPREVIDSSGNNFSGTPSIGADTSYLGISGRSAEFNGTTRINVSGFSLGNNARGISVAYWFNAKSLPLSAGRFVENGWPTGAFTTHLGPGGDVGGGVSGGIVNSPANVVSANKWYHFAMTYDDSSRVMRLYLNGTLISTQTTPSGIDKGARTMWIGGLPNLGLNIFMDELLIFDGQLTDSEVHEIYNKQNSVGNYCSDSDSSYANGKNYYVKGSVASTYAAPGQLTSFTDYCRNSNTLVEGYCLSNNILTEDFLCISGCNNGRCENVVIDENVISGSRVVELGKKVNFTYVLTLSQDEVTSVPVNLSLNLKTPVGLSSIQLSKTQNNASCYYSISGFNVCDVSYKGEFIANSPGSYYLHTSRNDLFITYVVNVGFVAQRIISSQTNVPLDIILDYDLASKAVFLQAGYTHLSKNKSVIQIQVLPDEASALINFDILLERLRDQNIETPTAIGSNKLYLFKAEKSRNEKPATCALWRSTKSTLFYCFYPTGSGAGLSVANLSDALYGKEIVFSESAKTSDLDSYSLSLLNLYLSKFPSSLDNSLLSCIPSWECTTAPLICPEHGFQNKDCVDRNNCRESTFSTIECTPGICSGCYYGDMNRCIPYGFKVRDDFGSSMYCDFTGELFEQMGDGATCNNDYECFSGECNSGVCVNTHITTVQNAKLLRKIWCKLLTLPILGGTEDDYLQCLGTYGQKRWIWKNL